MDDDFFDSTPAPQQQFQQYQQFDHQGDNDFAPSTVAETPSPTHAQPQMVGSGYGLYAPAPVAVHEQEPESSLNFEDETVLRIRREEEALSQKLRAKAEEEFQAKQLRRAEASKQLNDYLSSLENQKNLRREANREAEKSAKEKTRQYKSPWEEISANIALKQSDYAGSKDVTRMRQAILRKKEDALSQ